jgi:hypothetical protein
MQAVQHTNRPVFPLPCTRTGPKGVPERISDGTGQTSEVVPHLGLRHSVFVDQQKNRDSNPGSVSGRTGHYIFAGRAAHEYWVPIRDTDPMIYLIFSESWGSLTPKPAFARSWPVSTIPSWGTKKGLRSGPVKVRYFYPQVRIYVQTGQEPAKRGFWHHGPPNSWITSDLSWGSGFRTGFLVWGNEHHNTRIDRSSPVICSGVVPGPPSNNVMKSNVSGPK